MFALVALASFQHAPGQEVLLEWSPKLGSVVLGKLHAVKGPQGALAKAADFDADGHLIFDGNQAVTFPDGEARKLPLQNFTVEARVRVDQPHPWGAILAYSQDNGAHERGWILGYSGSQFCFKASTGGALTGAVSNKSFTPGEWAHLVGMYNGQAVQLYVNGHLVASAPLSGEVALPKEGTPFVLGAYKDDDEYFPTNSRIDRVRVYRGLLAQAELTKIKKEEQGLAFAVQPRVAFPDPATAVLSWQAQPGNAVLFYGSGETLDQEVPCTAPDGRFSARLQHLRPQTAYKFRLASGEGKERRYSKFHSFDTRFNLSPAPVDPPPGSSSQDHAACDQLIALAPDQSGYLLVLGLADGQLAAALAARSRFHIIAADYDAAVIAKVRQELYRSGHLGHRVSVLHLSDPGQPLPWTECFADLIVSEQDTPPVPLVECQRLLRPNGGILVIPASAQDTPWSAGASGWINAGDLIFLRRGDLAGARDWTHQYGTAGNAAYTGEALGEVSVTSGLEVQWIGQPGGDFGIDRQPRMPAPLAANGRLFHQGMDRLVALNAYNGAVLWSYEIPALRRLNVPHDCSNWSADGEHLFVAIRDRLWVLDARSGDLVHALQLPSAERKSHEWGFVANEGEVVIGSAVRADSAFQNFWGDGAWFDKVGSAGAIAQVCSERLFGYRKADAEGLWAYGRGLVINSTIALHEGKLYFLENRSLKLPEGAPGRVTDRRLWLDLTAVCLDAASGKVLWERPGPKPVHLTEKIGFVQAAYGIATKKGFLAVLSEGTVDEIGAYQKKGEFRGTLLDHDGELTWTTTSPWIEDHHGVHITHPVVTEDKLYLSPHVHDLATGQATGQTYGPRRGCSTIVATKNALMFRILGEGNSPLGLWNKETGSVSRFPRLRPSCWLNTLPAQGMLLVPEGGAGCSCGGWMETSIGFLPRKDSTPNPR